MSTLKVGAIRGVSASSDAVTVANDGTCTANITSNGGSQLSNRNKIHNGSFKINQRSASASTNNTFPCDRWKIKTISNGDGKGTYSQYAMTAGELNLTGQAYALKFDCTTAISSLGTSDGNRINHSIEGQDLQDLMHGTSNAKSATLSFWVKSNVVGTYSIFMSSSNTTATQYQIQEYTINAQNTWEKKTVTFTPFTTSMMVNTNNAGSALGFNLALGTDYHGTAGSWTTGIDLATSNQPNVLSSTDNNWYITGVQFEVGTLATDFEHRSFGQELELCKRYFQQIGKDASGNASQRLSIPFINEHPSNTGGYIHVRFHPEMRSTPTATIGSSLELGEPQVDKSDHVVSSFNAMNPTGCHFFQFGGGQEGSTGDTNMYIRVGHDANAFAQFSAEL